MTAPPPRPPDTDADAAAAGAADAADAPPFLRTRSRLIAIAYRMLGTRSEAEDVVQDVWLRWQAAGRDPGAGEIDNPEAWLVTVTTRAAIDRLRAAKLERRHYPGLWLPEPVIEDRAPSPVDRLGRVEEISEALLLLLERLTPEARAAFLWREVFDADYAEVARLLGKSEPACRQLVRRARLQLQDARPRARPSAQAHAAIVRGFARAATDGDFDGLRALLADEASLVGDGGGKVTSFPAPLSGGRRIAQLFYASARRYGTRLRHRLAVVNGRLGLLRFVDGALESVQSFETDGDRIVSVHVQRNPDKLARVAADVATLSRAPD